MTARGAAKAGAVIRTGTKPYYVAKSEGVEKTVVFSRQDFESALKKAASAKPSKSEKR